MEKFPRDFFICHTTDDKSTVVRSLYRRITAMGHTVWYDEAEITWGESITQKVNWGLANSRFVIVVLSAAFLKKHWPNRELNAALNVESSSGQVKVLPLLVGTPDERAHIVSTYPLLSDKRYLTFEDGEFATLDYEISRLSIVPRAPDRQVEVVTSTTIATRLDESRVSLSASPLKSLARMQDVGFILRTKAIGPVQLKAATLQSLSVAHRQQVSIGYLHAAFSRLTDLPRNDRASVLLDLDSSLLELKSPATLLAALAEAYNVSRSQLGVLFDEGAVVVTLERSRDALRSFADSGFSVGLSNFGDGYSSLGIVKRLPIKYISVSESFIRAIGQDENIKSLLTAIAALCKSMGFQSIGSRVSSEGQLDFLKAAGFDLAEMVPGDSLSESTNASPS